MSDPNVEPIDVSTVLAEDVPDTDAPAFGTPAEQLDDEAIADETGDAEDDEDPTDITEIVPVDPVPDALQPEALAGDPDAELDNAGGATDTNSDAAANE